MTTPDDVVAALRAAGCVFAEEEAELLLAAPGPLAPLLERRVAGEPLEQVLGWAGFDGLRVAMAPGVFVPRRRSELLVRLAADGVRAGDVVVDLCCGSGALGLALSNRVPGVDLHACDLDPDAVRCARGNLPGASVWQGDLWGALPVRLRGRVQVALANAPYVPSEAIALMPTEARDHEPRLTLDGGGDGLDVHRRIAATARDWLAPGGRLLIEVSDAQTGPAVSLFERVGLLPAVHTDDDLDATAVVGTSPLE
ncbi:MAG: putative protein N(5)-glutamine methyltransferase [Micropruina sp.]|uniref:putative protein N(5)-glutamine methyltransferase n=1 Tax=Micropruina sp. TaxID=2737536 RepID=UPI0039E2D14C